MYSLKLNSALVSLSNTSASHKLAIAQLARTLTRMVLSSFCSKIALSISEKNKGSSLNDGNNTNTPNARHAAALTLASVSDANENINVTANRWYRY